MRYAHLDTKLGSFKALDNINRPALWLSFRKQGQWLSCFQNFTCRITTVILREISSDICPGGLCTCRAFWLGNWFLALKSVCAPNHAATDFWLVPTECATAIHELHLPMWHHSCSLCFFKFLVTFLSDYERINKHVSAALRLIFFGAILISLVSLLHVIEKCM